jgi:YebC/PmpR family DNA-binding regulatory protein
MGRHATVAGRQASSAAMKGKLFTKLAREIMVSARSGSDLNSNSRLRLAVEKAREQNMPKDNIERAIKKGSGELEGASYEEITYEGYGPQGTAILVEVLTDNRNRTNPELRKIFQKSGGNMGEMGSVAWMFKKRGVFDIDLSKHTEDQVVEAALEAGAEDVVTDEGVITVYTDPVLFSPVKESLIKAGITFEQASIDMIPENTTKVSSDAAKQAWELVQKLEDYDDTQKVFYNFEIDKEEFEKILSSK